VGEKEQAFLKRAPALRKRDIEEINGLFPSYIFRRGSTGEIWATCCRQHETVPATAPIWMAPHVREPRNVYDHDPILTEREPCPFCGRLGTVKDIKYTGGRQNLHKWRRFVLLRWDGRALWACAGEASKNYSDIEQLTAAPMAAPGTLYRFGKDAVELVPVGYYGAGAMQRHPYAGFHKRTVDEPFHWSWDEGMRYAVLGQDALEKSPVRWCMAPRYFDLNDEAVKFLHLAHVYPRQVEMLMKAGLYSVIYDLAKRGVLHAKALNWAAADPHKAFKATPQEVKDFLRLTKGEIRSISVLETYLEERRHGERISMQDAKELDYFKSNAIAAMSTAREYKVSALRLWRYLCRQNYCRVYQLASAWADYVRMARTLGLSLHRSDVLLPKNVEAAHEETLAAYNTRLEEQRRQREAQERARREEQLREAQEGYEKRKERLEKRYGYAAGGYVIRVPEDGKEIENEGIALQHCVGGYAQRHLEGKTTILFLRREKAPGTPFLTIEMWDKELHQIHGYRNEGQYTAKGRFADDPRETFRWFLDPWLAWIEAGSRRRKDGTPIVPKIKEEKTA